jgi:hypothetical protein
MTTYDYAYDPAGRLWTATVTPQGGRSTTRTYLYDGNGNRTRVNGQLLGSYDAPAHGLRECNLHLHGRG